jgi:TRAP-type C4-dicarboxylate transport system permease small subunit
VGRPSDTLGRFLFRITYWLAVAGGLIMAGLAIMVVVSVVGRAVFSAPVYGDFEIVAVGTAIAVFLFLPYCHMKDGNVIVDFFLAPAPHSIKRFCDAAAGILYGTIAGILTWRTVLGAFEVHYYGEVSMILAIPVWWAFPFAIISFTLLTICCFYSAAHNLKDALQ